MVRGRADTMMRQALMIAASFAGLMIAGLYAPALAASGSLTVPIDEARPLKLAAPAAGVVIGNPSIAGVTLQSNRLLFVTGRAYGATNLIVVGENGRPLFESRITVVPVESGETLTVTKGTATVRHSCTPLCRETPDLTDDPDEFNRIEAQRGARAGAAAD